MSGRASSKRRLQLSEWIGSFQTFDCAAAASDYIIPALRLTFAIADEICKEAGEETGRSPAPRCDWINSIVVHAASKNNNLKNDGIDNNIIFDAILTDDDEIRVEILPSLFEGTANNYERQEDGILHSLGIVFYEIFSRGERPAELESKLSGERERSNASEVTGDEELSETGDEELSETGDEELSEDFDPFRLKSSFASVRLKNSFTSDRSFHRSLNEGVTTADEAISRSKNSSTSDRSFNRSFNEGVTTADELSTFQNLLSDYILSDDESTSFDMASQEGDGPRKKRAQNENNNVCSVSVEPLKEKGVPSSLCDLVSNMLNCADGTLRHDETYHDMSEVRDDLQLMLDKPSIYLWDQDLGMLSTTGLHIGDIMFGRKAELSAIKEAYQRTVSGDSELVTIYGHAGTGKSILAREFGKYVLSEGGIFLSGKFDQHQQGKPFSALASAFNQYCGIFLQNRDLASPKQKLANQINHVLGSEARHLAKLIPNLGSILGLELNHSIYSEGCNNAQNRLQYLLCRFVEVISSTFGATVTLCLDDLQWADSASVAAVNQLLIPVGFASQNTRFFFLGCHREGETDNSNSFWKSLCHSGLVNAMTTDVKLDCMDEEALTTMVSETLCLSPHLTRSLSSIIYHKTKGNPLFVSRLMVSLSKEGLLRPSLSRKRWEWDKEKIQSQKLPDDVAIFFTNSINALPEDVKASMCVLSCFGSSAETSFIQILERLLQKDLLGNLDAAVEEGLLDKLDGRYHFSHDRIQEAAYNMMNILSKGRFHFSYGMALAPLAAVEGDDSLLLTAANQLNLAGPEAVQEKSQNVVVADLNLQAGRKAMEMSDFELAYSYFNNGISFLRKEHWEEHYSLSLELFNLAAKCALTNRDIVSLKLAYEEVMAHGRSYGDKLNVMYFFTRALASSALPESIELGLNILANLGIELRGNETSMDACVQETEDLLSLYTDDELLNTKCMTDPTMIMAMKFLGKLLVGMSNTMPKSAPQVMQRIVQLSLEHGMSPVSPIGFVHLGSYIAKLGDISEGYHYVKLARSLLDKNGYSETAGEVIFIGTHVRAYVEPLQATLEYHNEGFAAAMASGDMMQAALNISLGNRLFFFSGVNLQAVGEKMAESVNFMCEKKMLIFMIHLQYLQHTVFELIGTDEKPKYEPAEEKSILATNYSVMTTYYFHGAYTNFIFRLYDDAKHNTEKYLDCIVKTWANLTYAHSVHAFYMGLIYFWLARNSREERQWHERGERSKLALKKWAESSQWTFENKWYLLEAEESYCNDDLDTAKLYYEKAISSAKKHKFVHEEALAYELAAYFYLELRDTKKAMDYFLLAHEKYHEWGAFGKCDNLFKFVERSFTPQVDVSQSINGKREWSIEKRKVTQESYTQEQER